MSLTKILEAHRPGLSSYEQLYKHFHSNPELSSQEAETAAAAVAHLRQLSPDFDIRSNIGGHGVVAILRNDNGPTVLSRADMDALPVEERTGPAYASTKRVVDLHGREQPVMHACGHDMHVTCLLAYAELMLSARDVWHGTIVLLFQPAEERGTGAQSMVDDGLVFSGHVVPARAGVVGIRPGTMASSCDNLRVTFHGRGGHASMPERLVDPIIMASSAVLRLQTLVSREIHPSEHAVVTCASFYSGTPAENVVSDDATITIDIRANNQDTRQKLYNGVLRIVQAKSVASNGVDIPTIVPTRTFPVTINDDSMTERVGKAFSDHFCSGDHSYVANYPRLSFSEDFCILASALLFAYGCTASDKVDQAQNKGTLAESIPGNHNSLFAPQIFPTIQVRIDAYALSALAWLSNNDRYYV
ncbi:metal-dependent amidase/aminoacylase/carboxypeptidase [Rhizodiscina lignyota]|uniref:Metal-dependent amidase/aminoacylase/carboxypeptidase n=1 Tax=Rhizodiscina lignyota TaxID=1504668 RepID=A0A9P4I496_9PEZI|nr:metal-dependent amidase/aminoacylase/carboxypeptidase [Rhizodiscina lignyota]